ncbi:MAG: RNase adaptor protein RapZ [Candidatus Lumbricidophila eiseniae]|uniref:RNase adaptor protein RapZ n=1 Tax=Candidatus Lumbricidiphila eiseniae TaxID=1969409 RepID=A0A2A6FTI1_9MICO|nr:MAG: RNase adaptor protein RapZ [Candidatus Lumbricidophila eiseniae]
MSDSEQEMLIVTGMSGAGRSTVANALEDIGWYVVDNLPPQMLRPLVELAERAGASLPRIAAVVDIRGRGFFSELQEIVQALRAGVNVRVMFLDATDAALVRRFESVRRPHPLQANGTLLDGIGAERVRMAEMRAASDILIDTSDLNIHQLAARITDTFAELERAGLRVTVQSFGFKYGIPTDADLVADARFLPNPFWNPELRALTGENSEVATFVLAQRSAQEFLDAYLGVLHTVFAGYLRENKRHATVAIGCTGGKHRSVALANEIATRLRDIPNIAVNAKHRDLGRE